MTLARHPVAQVHQALPLVVLLVASVQDLELGLKHPHSTVTWATASAPGSEGAGKPLEGHLSGCS